MSISKFWFFNIFFWHKLPGLTCSAELLIFTTIQWFKQLDTRIPQFFFKSNSLKIILTNSWRFSKVATELWWSLDPHWELQFASIWPLNYLCIFISFEEWRNVIMIWQASPVHLCLFFHFILICSLYLHFAVKIN